MITNNWLQIVISQVWCLPYLITYFVGMVLALVFWRKHPAASGCALAGFGVLLLNLLFMLARVANKRGGAGEVPDLVHSIGE